jgi:hypothetical protein
VLGFPIRTPPDHSLVANSPGLIAGSNVLHRLLMPRHPPCALHSLSQQRQNNTRPQGTCHSTRRPFTRNKTNQRTPDPPHNQGMSRQTLHTPQPVRKQATARRSLHTHHTTLLQACSEDARVHYADLKQQPHQPPHPHTRRGHRRREEQKPNHTPTRYGQDMTADPSGPNSVLDPTPTNAGHE